MADAITFRPRTTDQIQNLLDYVSAAKALPFMSCSEIIWEAPTWNLTGLASPERAGQTPTVIFGGGRSKDPALTGAIGEFARAYVAFRIAEEFGTKRQIGKFTKPIIAMRGLLHVMNDSGRIDLERVGPESFDAAMDHARSQGIKDYSLEQRGMALAVIARELNEIGVLLSPFSWEGGRSQKRVQSRINEEADRNFTQDEIEAVAEAFVRAKTPRQQVITSVLALLCSVPGRISEIFALPVDCDVIPDPGDGYQAGLRWRPKKGGAPQVKYVPQAMLPVVKEALERIKRHTEPARALASRVLADEDRLQAVPEGWPYLPGADKLTYDRALMVALRYTLTPERKVKTDVIEPITYHQITFGLQGLANTPSIFEEMGIRLKDGAPLIVNTH